MVKKEKEYFNLTEVMEMVDLKPRMVKYRMLYVKKKYKNSKELLFKGNKSWNIHKSIIFEFDRQRITKKEEENKYRTFVTVSPWGDYDGQSMVEVAKDIHSELSKTHENIHLHYFVERGLKGELYHLHFVTNLSMNYRKALDRASRNLVICNTDVRAIYEQRELLDYLNKEVWEKGYVGKGGCYCTFLDLTT